MTREDDLDVEFENLRPGDVKAHLAFAEKAIKARRWSRDIQHSLMIGVATSDKAVVEYQAGLAKIQSR